MAVTDGLADQIGNVALNVVMVIGAVILVIIALGGLIWWIKRSTRFNQFVCVLWEKDGLGNVRERKDKAGIFVDPVTGNKRFFIKKANVGLEPDNIPYIEIGKIKKVYLVRTGLKNYRYIRPKIDDKIIHFVVGEEDVNWSVNAYERQKKTFDSKKWLQYLPYISLAVVSIVILIMMMQLFKQFDVLTGVSESLKQTVHEAYLIRTYNGTMVIN